jgi:DEAD/DEAH box helicase domain-containing protein
MDKYLNAIELFNDLKTRLEDIVLGNLYLKDEKLQTLLIEIVKSKNEGLISEILIEGAFSAKKHNQTLKEVSFLNKNFLSLLESNNEFSPSFYPFKHQYETLKIVNEMDENNKPAIVVTAPTGAGKTESFLLPMLNDLISNPRKENEKGVRVIILYPMNALVMDQNKRLFSYLKGQSKVKMFFYNSETPETEKYVIDNEFDDKCFIRTRKEARKNPPDIMITNYSMLEYILSRPDDYPLIGNALRTIIVDEAHLYTGTLAAEVSLLLRRVVAKAKVDNSKILYFATSATLSDDEKSQEEFFKKFFNKKNIIRVKGEKEVKDIKEDINVDKEINDFRDISNIVTKSSLELYNQFKDYKIFLKIMNILSKKYTIKVNELLPLISKTIDIKTFLNILTIGAKARINESELPLLPHKLHLQIRSVQGFSVCINPNCPDSKIDRLGKVHHGIFYNCTTCQSPTLQLVKCSECNEHFFYGKFDKEGKIHLERFINEENDKNFILSFRYSSSEEIYIDKSGKKTSKYDENAIKFYKHLSCPICSNKEFIPLSISDKFLIPLVAETMLVNMPVIDKETKIFLPAHGRRLLTFSDSRSEAARLGPFLTLQHETQLFRRILVETVLKLISTNENEELKEYYKNEIKEKERKLTNISNDLIRKKLKEEINELKIIIAKMGKGIALSELIEKIKKHPLLGEFFDRERMKTQEPQEREQLSYKKNREAIEKNVYQKIVEALITPNIKDINLESLGLLKLYYPNIETINLSNKLKRVFNNNLQLLEQHKQDILNTFLYIFRMQKAITSEHSQVEEKDYEISKIGLGQYITFDAKGKNLFNLKVGNNSYIYNFMAQILRSFNISDSEKNIHQFLEGIFETFLEASKRDDIKWLEYNKIQTNIDSLVDAFRIVFYELNIDIPKKLYLNTINNTIWHCSINNLIPLKKRYELKTISQRDLDIHPYFQRYRKMYLNKSKELSMGLWAEEHSAQLAQKENRRLQTLFIQGKRNILSATTTLEVGIDIGGLSGVLMANVPPNKANYIQRSGRAGRRTDGSSIIVTYAKTRFFDQDAFRNFKFYLNKPHKKLTISLEKEKIAIRHFNSYLLSKFYETIINNKDQIIFNSFKKMGDFIGIIDIPPRDSRRRVDFESEDNSIFKQFITFLNEYQITDNDIKVFNEIFKDTKKFDYKELIKNFKISVEDICNKYINTMKSLYDDWNAAPATNYKNAIRYNIKQKYNQTLIEVFSNAQILPKYGFPIDVKTLQVINSKNIFDLSRDSFLALSEYVPGSKILAGGALVESKGISKHFTGVNLDEAFGEKGFIYTCNKGHFFISQKDIKKCEIYGCNGIIKLKKPYLIPEYGYVTSASDKLSYKLSNTQKIGKVEIFSSINLNSSYDEVFEYEDFEIRYKEKAVIYGINRGKYGFGFAICTKCGYAESETIERINEPYEKLSNSFKNHSIIYSESGSKCLENNSSVIWRNHYLMAKIITDAIIIIPKREIQDELVAETLANAMKLSGAEELGIDEREINTLVQIENDNCYILMYDNQSGGVGYVYDLAKNRWNNWIKKTKHRLYIDKEHNEKCISGCIKCVLTMNTNKPLPRRKTLDYLNKKIEIKEKKFKKIVKNEISDDDRFKKFRKRRK